MNVNDLVPKHKHDQEVIPKLKQLSFDELKPIIPKLLEWMQDMNWPIGSEVFGVLEPFQGKLTPFFLDILKTNDEEWKTYILIWFGKQTEDSLFIEEIKRIAHTTNINEFNEETVECAQEIIKGRNL